MEIEARDDDEEEADVVVVVVVAAVKPDFDVPKLVPERRELVEDEGLAPTDRLEVPLTLLVCCEACLLPAELAIARF